MSATGGFQESGADPEQFGAMGSTALLNEASLPPGVFTDRRAGGRRLLQLRTCLMPLRGVDDISCFSDNVSETGMHVTVPVGYGLAVGQRYELLVAAPGASVGLGPLLIGPGQYATIVRTQMQLGEGRDWIGVGLRFDQPVAMV